MRLELGRVLVKVSKYSVAAASIRTMGSREWPGGGSILSDILILPVTKGWKTMGKRIGPSFSGSVDLRGSQTHV